MATSVVFGRAGTGCLNFATPTIIAHEVGHAIHFALSPDQYDGAYSEAFGDTVAALVTDQPCIGPGYAVSDPTSCLRDLTSVTMWPDVEGGEVHQAGEPYGQFAWALRTSLGNDAGHPTPPRRRGRRSRGHPGCRLPELRRRRRRRAARHLLTAPARTGGRRRQPRLAAAADLPARRRQPAADRARRRARPGRGRWPRSASTCSATTPTPTAIGSRSPRSRPACWAPSAARGRRAPTSRARRARRRDARLHRHRYVRWIVHGERPDPHRVGRGSAADRRARLRAGIGGRSHPRGGGGVRPRRTGVLDSMGRR